jgi:hypothetical protein
MRPYDMIGLFAGITKRTPTIPGQKSARLFVLIENQRDANGQWIDAIFTMSEVTFASFRKMFDI